MKEDLNKAIEWYHKAAASGMEEAVASERRCRDKMGTKDGSVGK